MTKYARNTQVSRAQSLDEIERTLTRYGATGFAYGWEGLRAVLQFHAAGRRVRFVLQMPDPDDREFTHTPARGAKRSAADAFTAWDQSCRSRWRALALIVKAKLEAIESGITTFEDEFMAHIVLPSGRTVGEEVSPGIAMAYDTGTIVPLLPGPQT